jgi:D-alanyl-D-alanine-carboxypeptidase/D-alanyl-D-alanine-endopeptidase
MLQRRQFLLAALAVSGWAHRATAETLSADAIRAILQDRVDVARQSVGIVASALSSTGRRLVAYGRSDAENGRPLDGDSVFEIGSVTKVFTALLLADMAVRGEIALDDPAAKFLSAEVKMPERGGKQITLLDLVSYTSGLPNMPANFKPKDEANPYADYSPAQLQEFLADIKLTFDPGTHYEYANLGFALLGRVVELRSGRSYEDLLVDRICAPLGMESTRINLTASMRERLTRGHDPILQPALNWDLPTFAGAGALRSTANDLSIFVEAASGRRPGAPLAAAFAMMRATHGPSDEADVDAACGWFISTKHDDEIISKDGVTGAYSSFIGFSAHSGQGAILLSNAGYSPTVSDIGMHLVNADYPLKQYPPAIAVDAAVLAAYAGTYAMRPNFTLTIRADGARLFVRGSEQPEFELFADGENRFFMRAVDAQAIFQRDKDGQVSQLIWHQGGSYRYCARLP